MAGGSRRRLGATRFDFLASAFLASENLFCRQMSGEEDSVGAPGVFHQRISHTGPDTAGGGTTGGITAMEEKKKKRKRRQRLVLKMRVWSREGGDGRSFLEFRRFILDMRDGTRHQLTALNDGVNYKMAGC